MGKRNRLGELGAALGSVGAATIQEAQASLKGALGALAEGKIEDAERLASSAHQWAESVEENYEDSDVDIDDALKTQVDRVIDEADHLLLVLRNRQGADES